MKEESWVCVDGHGDERIFPCEPYRNFPNMDLEVIWGQRWTTGSIDTEFKTKGTIKYLIAKEMTYSDEPIKLK